MRLAADLRAAVLQAAFKGELTQRLNDDTPILETLKLIRIEKDDLIAKGKIKMVRVSDIQDNAVNWATVPYCDISDGEIEAYLLSPNDILFARTGGTVGKSYIVSEVPEPAVYAGYLIRTQYSSKLIPQYLKYFIK